MQNSMIMLTSFVLDPKFPFLDKFCTKNKNYQVFENLFPKLFRILIIRWWYSLKTLLGEIWWKKIVNLNLSFVPRLILNSIFIITKYSFWVNLVRKIKIVCLSWNLIHTLIRIWNFEWWWSLFLFWPKIPFLGKLNSNNQYSALKLKLSV